MWTRQDNRPCGLFLHEMQRLASRTAGSSGAPVHFLEVVRALLGSCSGIVTRSTHPLFGAQLGHRRQLGGFGRGLLQTDPAAVLVQLGYVAWRAKSSS